MSTKSDGDEKKKEKKKAGRKDSQLIVRLDRRERDAFVRLCKETNTTAAREIRGFIRDFIEKTA